MPESRCFERLGIDPLKEGEAVHYGGVPPGSHAYEGWFYFVGNLLTPGERWIEVKGGRCWLQAAQHKIEEHGFFYYVSALTPKPPAPFHGKPTLALEYETRLPWVLAEPPQGPFR